MPIARRLSPGVEVAAYSPGGVSGLGLHDAGLRGGKPGRISRPGEGAVKDGYALVAPAPGQRAGARAAVPILCSETDTSTREEPWCTDDR